MLQPKNRQLWAVKSGKHILGYVDAVSRTNARSVLHGWFGYSHQLKMVAVHGKISELTPILITRKRKAEIRAENEWRFGVGWDVVDLGVKS